MESPPTPRAAGGGFSRQRQQDGSVLFAVRPARPALAFLAAVLLLAGLFGLPALAVLVDPGRHDTVSLAAAGCALLIIGLAVLAWRHARRGRAPREIRLDARGLSLAGALVPWESVRSLRVERPGLGRYAGLGGIHGLGAAVAAQQQAAEARLVLDCRDRTEPLLVAAGLGAEIAEALREALQEEKARLGA
jgi:hypothetical protein